jgi:hypothetical protein
MADKVKPGLFGVTHSNRDFANRETWGKNQFNSSLPASLAAFISRQGLENIYLTLDENFKVIHGKVSSKTLFGIEPTDDNLFFGFENPFTPYQQLLIGHIPRIDLVTQRRDSGSSLKGIEIKLTALPDNSTCNLTEDKFGCEIVIRPDTIVYLACSIAINYTDKQTELKQLIGNDFDAITDWTEAFNVIPYIRKMIEVIDKIALANLALQEPLVMQPIWKTQGKSPKLSDNCLDVFVWSNLAFAQLFCDVARTEISGNKITRQIRTIVWLFKMLYDFSRNGQINHLKIIDELSYNTKNDKAFAVSGRVTHPYMKCAELTKPRITKDQIREIIIGGGQNLLSPERRFDAIIFNSPELFA